MSKVEKIRKEIERLKKSLPWGSCASQLSMECNCKNEAYNEVLSYIDSLKEPVKRTPADIEAAMQEVEEKSKLFTEAHKEDVVSNDTLDDLEEAARKIATRHSHITEDTYYANDAWFFKKGAQWQKEQDQSTIELAEDHAYLAGQERIINKACEWLETQLDNYLIDSKSRPYISQEGIKEFRKAMEE